MTYFWIDYRDASMILYRVAALALYIFTNCKVIIMRSVKSTEQL